MTDTPVFLLGLGAQKAGTSWLHDVLQAHPNCDTGLTKEYHVLDRVYLPDHPHLGQRGNARRVRLTEQARAGTLPRKHQRLMAFRQNPDLYFDHLAGRIAPGVTCVADITPTYMLLQADHLAQVARAMTARGVETRPVLILRDPVDRIWSALRMSRQKSRPDFPGDKIRDSESDQLNRFSRKPRNIMRGAYDHTLAALDTAGLMNQTLVLFYEEMFTPPQITRLWDHLRLPARPVDLTRRVNATRKTTDLPETLRREIATRYRSTYASVMARFGAERVRALWPDARWI